MENYLTQEFYTSASVHYGKVLYRGYKTDDAGMKKRVHGKLNYMPTMYLESDEPTEFQSLHGKPLKPRQFDSMPLARQFVKDYEDVMPIYGYAPSRFEYDFLAGAFPGKMEFGVSDICVGSVDIETTTEHGKIDTVNVPEEITLVTYQNIKTKALTTYGSRPSTRPNFVLCRDEKDLLTRVVRHVEMDDPDVITGWNVAGFDVPYLINRTNKICGEEVTKRLSPFGIITMKEEDVKGKMKQVFTIVGRTILDMLELYLKFTFVKRVNNKLDTIAKIELGVGKNVNPYPTFREFYEKDWDLFVDYNQIDTIRVSQMEDKLGLIALALAVAYKAKINFGDVYGPVKTWECMILSELRNENTFVAVKRQRNSSDGIIGAYVHNPVPGFYDWLLTIDAEALYPSIAIGLNQSPETLMHYIDGGNDLDMMAITKAGGVAGIEAEIRSGNNSNAALVETPMFLAMRFAMENDYTCASNGAVFSKTKQGIIPRIMQGLKDGRNLAKREMLDAKQLYIDTNDIKYKKIADLKGTIQLALKVLNNSGYGAISQSGFIFFDNRIAEGITMTGRYIIQYVSFHFNKRLNDFFKTVGHDYIAYMDTDSSMFALGNIVKKYYATKTPEQIVEALDVLMEKHLRPFINEATDTIAMEQNYFKKTIFFKREKICSSGFWVAPKKYALKVYDNEGVRYKEPDYAITGIEVVRSSTPEMARNALKECVIHVINKDIDALRLIVERTHEQFKTFPAEDIAFPRGVNNLEQYSDDTTIYGRGTPIAVRGALMHNHFVEKLELGNLYQPINEGDKILFLYLQEPNHFKENVISFVDTIPKEFNLDKYVDREMQFEKVFVAPLQGIMKAVGWTLVEQASLDDFFG